MNDYFIGAGAVLTAGPAASIATAALHAQTDASLAASVRAAVIDFESTSSAELTKVLVVAAGWNSSRVRRELVEPLVALRECSLADVIAQLARASGCAEVHVFAQWFADEQLCAAAAGQGVTLVSHSLDSIRQAALISGQRVSRWPSPLRAA